MLGWLLVLLQFACLGWLGWIGVSSWPWNAGSWALLALSAVVFALALAALGSSTTPHPTPNLKGLRVHGIYSMIRNPMYLALLLGAIAIAIEAKEAWIPAAVLAVVLAAKILLEERELKRAYAGYEMYSRRTKRLIPWVW